MSGQRRTSSISGLGFLRVISPGGGKTSSAFGHRRTSADGVDIDRASDRSSDVRGRRSRYSASRDSGIQRDEARSVMQAISSTAENSDDESDMGDEEEYLVTGQSARHDKDHDKLLSNTMGFKGIAGAIIMANTIVIALEALYIQQQWEIFDILEFCFTIFYTVEIAWRIFERGVVTFFTADDYWWNWFDFVITGASIVDTVSAHVKGHTSGASVGRLFRVFRILRMFRAVRFLHEVDYVLAHAAQATMKLSMVVSLVLFVAAIVATNMLWDCSDEIVSKMFGDLGQSMWSLFKLMTLDDWVPVSERVIRMKPCMRIFFVVFIFSTSIALISLVPAIFIEISLNSKVREDHLYQERQRLQIRKQKTRLLRTLFKLTDHDSNGRISVDEMKTVLTNDVYLRQLQEAGLTEAGDVRDVRLGLFDLWEAAYEEGGVGGETDISEEEFISGLLRAREDVSQAVIWRCTTATRLMLRDFSALVQQELRTIRHDTKGIEREVKQLFGATQVNLELLRRHAVMNPEEKDGLLKDADPAVSDNCETISTRGEFFALGGTTGIGPPLSARTMSSGALEKLLSEQEAQKQDVQQRILDIKNEEDGRLKKKKKDTGKKSVGRSLWTMVDRIAQSNSESSIPEESEEGDVDDLEGAPEDRVSLKSEWPGGEDRGLDMAVASQSSQSEQSPSLMGAECWDPLLPAVPEDAPCLDMFSVGSLNTEDDAKFLL